MNVQPATILPASSHRAFRSRRVIATVASATLLCSGLTSCTKTQVGLSVAAVAAVVVGTTVGITLAVQHSHRTLQGCAFTDVDGLKLRLSDAKVYALKGELADIKVGDKLSIHGSKLKKVMGNSTNSQTVTPVFVVEKLNKDYGPCPATPSIPATP